MTPFAQKEVDIISDKNITFALKIEQIIKNIVTEVQENPSAHCTKLIQAIVFFDFALSNFRMIGYNISEENNIYLKKIAFEYFQGKLS